MHESNLYIGSKIAYKNMVDNHLGTERVLISVRLDCYCEVCIEIQTLIWHYIYSQKNTLFSTGSKQNETEGVLNRHN